MQGPTPTTEAAHTSPIAPGTWVDYYHIPSICRLTQLFFSYVIREFDD